MSLIFEKVSKTYPSITLDGPPHVAVRDLDLTVDHGELLTLIGPSGCGKSSILRMVAGLETVSSGRISLNGAVINDLAPKKRPVALVFQNYALYLDLTVRENLGFGLNLRKIPKKEVRRRIEQVVAVLGLTEDDLERKPAQLSGGQRQRVALGRCMVLQPEIFLLDEPLSNLDARLREQIRREITTIHRESGATMIHVTHDQAEAMSLGRRIGVMAQGRLLQVGTPLELYQRPANLQVATFMGNSPMNFLVGEIIVQQGQLFFHELTRHLGPGTALLPLTAAQVMQLSGLTHQRILLGIRPEHLTIRPAGPMPSPHPILRTTLKVVDHLGSESRLTVDTGTHSLVLRAPGWFPGIPQESVELLVQMEQAMFFEYREPSPLPDAGAIDQELWRIGCGRY